MALPMSYCQRLLLLVLRLLSRAANDSAAMLFLPPLTRASGLPSVLALHWRPLAMLNVAAPLAASEKRSVVLPPPLPLASFAREKSPTIPLAS